MFNRTIKTALVATAIVIATAGASFASTWAHVDHDTKVKLKRSSSSESVNYVEEGQKVKIIDHKGGWYKIQIPGKDGWVKEYALDFGGYDDYYDDYSDYPTYPSGGSFCLSGDSASFCLSSDY